MLNLFYRNPRLLILTLLLILAAGMFSFQLLPRSEDPKLTPRFATVYSRFPGATAERVESLVTERLEEELKGFDEIKTIDAVSRTGIAVLQIELQDEVTKVSEVWSRVRDKLDDAAAELPAGASPPEFEDEEIEAYTFIAALTWEPETPVNRAILRRYGEALQDELRALPGTVHTQAYGEAEEEIQIVLDVERLSALDLSVAEVSAAIRGRDAKVPAGLLRGRTAELPIEVAGEPTTLRAVAELPLLFGADGKVVRVQDIARIEKGTRTPLSDVALVAGKPAIVVSARASAQMRVDRWAEQARARLARFEESLPGGLQLRTIFDHSIYVEARFSDLYANLILGTLAVLVVSFFMMGWKSALLIAAALPLTSLMVLGGMNLLRVPMHQMSVTGLIIALGMMIDNAIIMVDEVRHRRLRGLDMAASIAAAVKFLAVPLLGSTLTTVLAFMPLILMPGPAGEFVGSISITVILALISSLFLALTVTPALSGWLERAFPEASDARPRWWRRGLGFDSWTRAFRASLDFLLARPALGLAVGLALPLVGFWKMSTLEEQFFPPAERDQFQVQLSLPRSTSLEETERVAQRARELMLAHEAVAEVHWFVGTSAPPFYYNMISGEDGSAYFAQAMVQLHSKLGAREIIRTIQSDLDRELPQAQSLALQLEQGPPFPAPIELRIYGPDLDRLHEIGERYRAELTRVPEVTHTRVTLKHGQPKLWFELDEQNAELAGLGNVDVAQQLQQALEGATGGSVMEETEELPIRVRLSDDHRQAITGVNSIELEAPRQTQGEQSWIPLSAMGRFDLVPEWAAIPHRDGRRLLTVQGFITAGVLPAEVLGEYRARLEAAGIELPIGYELEFGGESQERDEAVANLMASVGLLVTLMGAALVLSFRSFRMAAVIAVIGALSMGLGLASLWLFDLPFGFMAIVGTMGLIGVAINDSIVVLAGLRDHPEARLGDRQAIRDVVVHSARHILTTTVTTAAGFMPLILAGGQFWPPLAIAIAGGVVGATLLALYFVPSIYAILIRRPRAEARVVAVTAPAPA